jgi:hypothetical protein
MAAFATTLLALISVSGVSAAPVTWQKPVDLRVRAGALLSDAAGLGNALAIVWSEPGDDNSSTLGLRVSTNAGSSFQQGNFFARSQQGAAAICGDRVAIAFIHHPGPHKWHVDYAIRDLVGGPFERAHVHVGGAVPREPDIACANGRVLVSWLLREGNGHRRLVASALLDDGVFGAPIDLGIHVSEYYSAGLSLAASGSAAYAVFNKSRGDLRLKRWTIGSGSGHKLNGHPIQTLYQGTRNCPATSAEIAAHGNTVVVGWDRNSTIHQRVSTDRGLTWGPVRGEDSQYECESIVEGAVFMTAIALAGSRMVATEMGCGFFDCGNFMEKSNDRFAHAEFQSLGNDQIHHIVFVTVNGAPRFADAYSTDTRIRFRRQVAP